MALPNYTVLDSGLYEINRAEVQGRIPGTQKWFGMGDTEGGTLNVAATKLARFRKNARVRTKAVEITTQTDSALSLILMQRTPWLSGLQVMGAIQPLTQAAVPSGTYVIDSVEVSGRYYVEKQDISAVALTDESEAVWVLGTHFLVVDAPLGMIEVIALPEGVTKGDVVNVGFTAAAIDEDDELNQAVIGSKTEFVIELMIRELGEHAKPRVFHLYECPFTMDGDLALIGGDDFAQTTISGSALDQGAGRGVGIMKELSE